MRRRQVFGDPHVAAVTTERDLGVYAAIDCGVYLGCFLIAAQSLGVATIPKPHSPPSRPAGTPSAGRYLAG